MLKVVTVDDVAGEGGSIDQQHPIAFARQQHRCGRPGASRPNYNRVVQGITGPELAERVRNGKREERFVGTADTANFFRWPFGPGWALVGDAGYHKDPSTAQGMSDGFRDAELLAAAIDDGFAGRRPLAEALADYETRRNAASLPMYEFTQQISNLEAPIAPDMQRILAALSGNQAETDRFFGTWAGTIPIPEFFAPERITRIMESAQVGPPAR